MANAVPRPNRRVRSSLLPAIVLVATLALVIHSARQTPRQNELATETFGTGPTIVLVHGLGGSADDWMPVARKLSRTHRVVLAQLPGHGRSPMEAPLSIDGAADALAATIAREGRGAVTLVGHSVGGVVATRVALDHPARIRNLVLIETALKPPMEESERLGMLRMLDRDYHGLVAAAYSSFGRDSVQGVMLAEQAERQSPSTMKPWIRLALRTDLSLAASDLRVPVTAVWSDRSWPLDQPWAAAAHELGYERVPRVDPVRFEGCGHFIMLDRPSDLARLIARVAGGIGEVREAQTHN